MNVVSFTQPTALEPIGTSLDDLGECPAGRTQFRVYNNPPAVYADSLEEEARTWHEGVRRILESAITQMLALDARLAPRLSCCIDGLDYEDVSTALREMLPPGPEALGKILRAKALEMAQADKQANG